MPAGWPKNILLLLVAFLGLWASPTAAAKTDVVVLENGDTITGELKSLDRAKLRFKTDSMGTLEIEWQEVSSVTAKENFEVELESGEKIYGSLAAPEEPRTLRVVAEDGIREVANEQVVRITQIKGDFLERLSGSLDLGFSFVQANKATSLALNGDVSSRRPKHLLELRASSTLSDQEDVDRVARNVGSFTFTRFLGAKWQTMAVGKLESNEELGLDSRITAAAGAGRFAIQTNHSTMLFLAGLAVNRESYSDAPEAEANLEGLAGLEYSLFRFGERETDLSVRAVVLPSLSESDRVRIEVDVRYRHELIKDFYLAVTLYESFDSEPPTVDAVRNDWGLSTSIGYSF